MYKMDFKESHMIKNKVDLNLSLEEYVCEWAPIGTRIETIDDLYIKIDKDKYYDTHYGYIINSNEVFKYDRVMNVLPPHYDLIFFKASILDEQEKEYLRNVIKPFRNRIVGICKNELDYYNEEYITIEIKDNYIEFPTFKKGAMYKGMKGGITYTLEELDL